MTPAPVEPHRSRGERTLLWGSIAVLACLVAWRWHARARHFYEWDSAQYALGAHDFDIHKHQPHPPGYPLWILALKGVHLLVPDLNLAEEVLGVGCIAAAITLFYRLTARLYDRATALLAAGLLLFSPTVIFYGDVASTYPVDLLTSVLVGSLADRAFRGDKRAARWAAVAAAALAGVRQSGATMMLPLVAVGLLRANRRDARAWLVSATLFAAVVAAWYVPTGLLQGGIVEYAAFSARAIRGYFADMSVFFGAPREAHVAMLHNVAIWAGAATAVAAATTAILWAAGRYLVHEAQPAAPLGALGFTFFALWIVPNALYITLFHSPKPGYLMLDLPPLFLLSARFAAPGLRALGARFRLAPPALSAACAGVVALASTALASVSYDDMALRRDSLASVRDSDRDSNAIARLVSNGEGQDGTLVVVFDKVWAYGPNVKSLALDLPETRIASLLPAPPNNLLREFRWLEFWDDRLERKEIPAEIRTILWLLPADAGPPSWLEAAFPDVRRVYAGRTARVYETRIGDLAFEAQIVREGRTFRLARFPPAVMRALLQTTGADARFGDGWYGIDIPRDGDTSVLSPRGDALVGWRWMGERGQIDIIPEARFDAIHLSLEGFIPASLLPSLPTLTLTLDGSPLDTFVAPAGVFRKEYRLAKRATPGKAMSLVIATSATAMAPSDPRRLGFALSALSLARAAPPDGP